MAAKLLRLLKLIRADPRHYQIATLASLLAYGIVASTLKSALAEPLQS